MSDIHARTSAAFLADAAARCAAAAAQPVEPGAADAALAALSAALDARLRAEAGAVESPLSSEGRDVAWRASRPDAGGALTAIRPAPDSGEAWPGKAPIRDAYAPAPWPTGMVPQQAQQQQAAAASLYAFQVRGEAADMATVRTPQDVEGITPRTIEAQTVTVRTRADWYAFSRACRTVARKRVEQRRGGESIFWAMIEGRVHRLTVERHSFGSVQRLGGHWHRVCHGSPVALATARLTERPRRALISAELAWAARYRANAMRDARERQAHRRALSVQAVRACIVEARGLWSALDRLPG